MKPDELERIAVLLRELGMSYDETVKLMSGVMKDSEAIKSSFGKSDAKGKSDSQLIRLGVSLIAFPIPTIGIKKSLGAMLIAAGLVQQRWKHIHVTDVYSTFRDVQNELRKLLKT